MRIYLALQLAVFSLHLGAVQALSFLALPRNSWLRKSTPGLERHSPQILIMPVVPPSDKDEGQPPASGDLIISDVIGKERSINIFAGFTRDIESISSRLDNTSQNSTILAPLNSEVQKLPRKPWEDPEEYNALGEDAYKGASGEDRAQANLRRFVEAHIVASSPWKEGDKTETLSGNNVWWETKDGKRMVGITLGFVLR